MSCSWSQESFVFSPESVKHGQAPDALSEEAEVLGEALGKDDAVAVVDEAAQAGGIDVLSMSPDVKPCRSCLSAGQLAAALISAFVTPPPNNRILYL